MVESHGPDGKRNSDTEESPLTLMIPWSCREDFTENVCGLPGSIFGCSRFRAIGSSNNLLQDNGINPCLLPEDIGGWIVFESPIKKNADMSPPIYSPGEKKPEYSIDKHQIFFAFPEGELKKKSRGFGNIPRPSFVEYRALDIKGDAIQIVQVNSWLGNPETFGLHSCFGKETFIKRKIAGLSFELSIADLINAYLNNRCSFRREDTSFSKEVGITKCKVELMLHQLRLPSSNIVVSGKQPGLLLKENGNSKGVDSSVFDQCRITFSFINPSTFNLVSITELDMGGLRISPEGSHKDSYDRYFRPLSVIGSGNKLRADQVTYADCLSGTGRQYILPAEVARSFLCFSRGEVVMYLLHWLLLRVFACEVSENREFFNKFYRWRRALRDNKGERLQIFADLLETEVVLYTDPATYRRNDSEELGEQNTLLCIYESPCPFKTVLTSIGLGLEQRVAFEAARSFSRALFSEDNSRNSLLNLSMYKDLKWCGEWLSEDDFESSSNDCTDEAKIRTLQAILSCVAFGSGIVDESPDYLDEQRMTEAKTELREHVRRSVFPIGYLLANWPRRAGVTNYYIIPLWDDKIQDLQRPVIFAHVFTNAIPSNSTADAALEFGKTMQGLLTPLGAAIAHNYYSAFRKVADESEKKMLLMGGIAHAAGNALAMTGVADLISLFSATERGIAPIYAPPRIPKFKLISESSATVEEAMRLLRGAWVGKDAIQSLIALVEIAARPGPLRKKFQTTKEYSLEDCLNTAIDMTRIHIEKQLGHLPEIKLDYSTKKWVNAKLPQGYLRDTYIQTFLYELLLNLSKYAKRSRIEGRSQAKGTLSSVLSNGTLEIYIFNALANSDEGKIWEMTSGGVTVPADSSFSILDTEQNEIIEEGKKQHTFLRFASAISSYIPGIRITSNVKIKDGKKFYLATLSLGPIVVEYRESERRIVAPYMN